MIEEHVERIFVRTEMPMGKVAFLEERMKYGGTMDWHLLSETNLPVAAAMIKCGTEWKIKDVNNTFAEFCEMQREELIALVARERAALFAPADVAAFEAALERASDGVQTEKFMMRIVDSKKQSRWVRVAMSFYCTYNAVPYVVAFFFDAQEEKDMEQRLATLLEKEKLLQEEARRDSLTKLLDKEETKRMINRAIGAHPEDAYTMLLIDIDNFKQINDTFGHTYGDTVILDVASMIREQFGKEDIVGRIGGDEFLVFMTRADLAQGMEKAQILCSNLEKEYTGGNVTGKISVSIGISSYGKDGKDYRSLMEKADHAMYRVKKSGKNSFEIARSEDVGPLREDTKAVERRGEINRSDSEFLSFAVSLMTHARNIDGSLNMLLKHIAERMELELVGVFEHAADAPKMVLTNYYSSRYSYYDKTTFPMGAQTSDMNVAEFRAMTGLHIGDYPLLEQLLKNGQDDYSETTCSVAIAKFEYVNGRTGEVAYLSLDEQGVLSESARTLLQELGRIIGIFVSLRYRMDESKAQIRHIQMCDQLTGMYTLEAFKSKVPELIRNPQEGKTYFLEYLDINNFGYINDNYGYKVGDNVLKMFASDYMMQDYFEIGCRLYSDFFVMLLKADDIEQFKKNVMAQHQRFANIQNHQYPSSSMSISCGVYQYGQRMIDVENAIENATMAWKMAKRKRSKEPVFYDDEYRNARTREKQVVGEFYEALYRDDFRMYLQPKFAFGSREVYGAEALARWQKPDGNLLAPAAFLAPLEQIGYIMELDFYIFEELLKTMTRWQAQNRRKIIVSTNFSGRHFESGVDAFLNRICHILSKYSVSPKNIEIEVTESVLIRNLSNLQYCIDKLHEIGFRVAIDDFGTGYSSLSALMDIPADVIKMDKSFIDSGFEGKRRDLIVEIGELVRISGKEIIFEGVETEEQERLLIDCGYRNGQGYLCNRPITISEFEKLYF